MSDLTEQQRETLHDATQDDGAVRAAIRTEALDRFTSDYLANDARDWLAGFSARAAMRAVEPIVAQMLADERERILSLAWKHANSRKTPAGPYVDSVTLNELAHIARQEPTA